MVTVAAFSLPLAIRSDGGVKVKSSAVGTAGATVYFQAADVRLLYEVKFVPAKISNFTVYVPGDTGASVVYSELPSL